MPHLVVAGFHASQIRQILDRGGLNLRGGWTVRYVPSDMKSSLLGFRRSADIITEAATQLDSHIVAVSQQANERAQLAGEIRRYFRFRWLSAQQVTDGMRERFLDWVGMMQPVLEEEEDWSERVKPSACEDALMLPQSSFKRGNQFDIWGASEAYNDPHAVNNAEAAIERFARQHWKPISEEGYHARRCEWIDDNSLSFDHRGDRHASAPHPRNWKYSYKYEDGFHYDVSHSAKRRFTLNGMKSSKSAPKDQHINIDCHGYFRGEVA